MGLRMDELPEHLRKQVQAKQAAENAELRRRAVLGGGLEQLRASDKPPNATERAALDLLRVLAGGQEAGWIREGRTFPVLGRRSYTPDWVLTGSYVAVEVKGEYVHSRDSAILFDAARHEYPDWTWIWMRRRSKTRMAGGWQVEIWPAKT